VNLFQKQVCGEKTVRGGAGFFGLNEGEKMKKGFGWIPALVCALVSMASASVVVSISELGTDVSSVNTIDLTTLGSTDWAMLGQGADTNAFTEMAGADYIADVAVSGGSKGAFENSYLCSWNNGAGTETATAVKGSWEASYGATISFSVTNLEAGDYTMNVYSSKYRANGALTVTMGTESVTTDFTVGGSSASSEYGVFTVNFTVDTTGDSLDVAYTTTDLGKDYGNVGITAITLASIPEPATMGMLGLGALVTLLVRRGLKR
jgi:hypothetical protein